MLYPNPDMILAIAIGDAYGAGFEFTGKSFIRENHTMERYVQNPRYPDLLPGMYTDDTQMSIAIAEWLTGEEVQELPDVFVEVYKRDPRKGYGKRIQAALDSSQNGNDFETQVSGFNSIGNGSAMRAVPLGILPIDVLVTTAAAQAMLTHGHYGVGPAVITAAMSYFSLYEHASFAELETFLFDHFCDKQEDSTVVHAVLPWHGGPVPCDGSETVRAVFSIVTQATSLKDALDRAIKLGGDTDSVAAIALGIASARLENDIPTNFVEGLEVGRKYGPEFLKRLGRKLMIHGC